MKSRNCFNVPLVFMVLFLCCFPAVADDNSPDTISIGDFSREKEGGDFPEGWKPLTFKKIENHTSYSIVRDGEKSVVRAESHSGASGLTRELLLDPSKYQVLEWDWKITGVLAKGDVTRKKGDDYPARIYITFKYDPSKIGFSERVKFKTAKLLYGKYPPMRAINYIWASSAKTGTVVSNPYTDRVKMIVLQSGVSRKGEWIHETRNVLDDFRQAFGEEPSDISGIAVMTDTDNTGESAVSFYGDIFLRKAKP